MYPDLSYFFHDFLGTEPDNWTSIFKTFGFMVVMAILVAAFMLGKELKRKEEEGLLATRTIKRVVGQPASILELLGNALVGFLLGFKFFYIIQHFEDFQIDPAAIVFSGLGNWLGGIGAALFFAGVKYFEKHQERLPEPVEKEFVEHPWERIGDITIVSVMAGVFGAKIFAMVEDLDLVFDGTITFGTWLQSLFSGSGMAIYGGLIVGFVVGYLYVKSIGIKAIHVLDAAAPALLVSVGVGRMGCHLSGDGDWGIPVEGYTKPSWLNAFPDWFWSYHYPHNVLEEGIEIAGCTWRYCRELSSPVFPTSVYEIIMLFALGGILWALRKKVTIPGMLFSMYLIFNGVERFFIEKFRINDKYDVLGFQMTQAEIISVVLILLGILGCLILWRRGK